MLRITFLAVLLLTGCENNQVKHDQVTVGQAPQIESPLQNTAEGMAKAEPGAERVATIKVPLEASQT